MSKFDYKKELKESVYDGAIMTAGLLLESWLGSKVGISKPSLTMNAENIGKIIIYLTAADMLKDYAKDQKWISLA